MLAGKKILFKRQQKRKYVKKKNLKYKRSYPFASFKENNDIKRRSEI